MSDTVRVLEVEIHPTLKKAPRFVLAVVHSSNAIAPKKTEIKAFRSFEEALPFINHEVRIRIKLPNGEWMEVDHAFRQPGDLEANAGVDSRNIDKAGILARIPETREMLILKAFLSDVSNRLKNPKRRKLLDEMLKDKSQYLKPIDQKSIEIH